MSEFWFIHNLKHKNNTKILMQRSCTEITVLQVLEDFNVATVKGALQSRFQDVYKNDVQQ